MKLVKLFIIIFIIQIPVFSFGQGKVSHPNKQISTPSKQSTYSIPNTVAGYSLGVSTRKSAEKYTYDKGYSLSYPSGSKLTAHYVDFAGYVWNDVELYFENNKLFKIVFMKPDIPSEHNSYSYLTPDSEIFSTIAQNLSSKYSMYRKGEGIYNDGKTTITINDYQLIYSNNALSNKAMNSYDNL